MCYRNSLIWGCEAVRDVLRVGFASVGIGVGALRYRALDGVWRGKTWRFWRVLRGDSGGVVSYGGAVSL